MILYTIALSPVEVASQARPPPAATLLVPKIEVKQEQNDDEDAAQQFKLN